MPEAFLSPRSCCRNDRQHNMRWMRGVMNYALAGDAGFGVVGDGRAGIEVAVKAREVTAADLQADGVPGTKEIRRHPAIDDELFDLSGRKEFGWAAPLPVATPDNAVAKIPGRTVRKDVDQ